MNTPQTERGTGTFRGYVMGALTASVVLLLIAAFFYAFLLAPAVVAGAILIVWVFIELVRDR